VLTVSDGTNTAELTFSDFTGGFNFASDGNGGTLIYDPPASKAATGIPIELGDNFVFHPGIGAEAVGSFDPKPGKIEFDHLASWQTTGPFTPSISPDDYSHAWTEPGHHSGLTPQQFEAVLASTVHLH
jgi:hypothetical protein